MIKVIKGVKAVKKQKRELFVEGKAKIYTKYIEKNNKGN